MIYKQTNDNTTVQVRDILPCQIEPHKVRMKIICKVEKNNNIQLCKTG